MGVEIHVSLPEEFYILLYLINFLFYLCGGESSIVLIDFLEDYYISSKESELL